MEEGLVDNLPFSKEEEFAHTLDQPGMSMFLISSQGNSLYTVRKTLQMALTQPAKALATLKILELHAKKTPSTWYTTLMHTTLLHYFVPNSPQNFSRGSRVNRKTRDWQLEYNGHSFKLDTFQNLPTLPALPRSSPPCQLLNFRLEIYLTPRHYTSHKLPLAPLGKT